jgi:MoxR-vWA-beta-propeller ternary system domain bpX4
MPSPLPSPGTVVSFFRELRTTGTPVVRITGPGDLRNCLSAIERDAEQDQGLVRLLREWHSEALLDLPGAALDFDSGAARWGAKILFRAAWFYMDRESDPSLVASLLAEPLPMHPTPPVLFSLDLALQSLPEIYRLAQTLAPGDPLLVALRSLALRLPFSGVGIEQAENGAPLADPAAWSALISHSGLWQIFIDRVIRAKAHAWLGHESVRDAVVRVGGAFPQDLLPALDLSQSPPLALS